MSVRSYDELLADCVHCGFCLPACPTYRSWDEEMDSPRGRIDLMKGVDDGAIDLGTVVTEHIDACLGCMGCVTACPSGVRYDLLIEATRAKVEAEVRRAPQDRAFRELMFALFPHPSRLRLLSLPLFFAQRTGLQAFAERAGLFDVLPPRLRQLAKLSPPLSAKRMRARLPARMAAVGRKRGTVAMVAGCVQRVFFPEVNAATMRVLAAEGYDVIVPPEQGCCGALSLHSGRADEAQSYARALIERFGPYDVDAIVINAAGCGSTLKQYGELFADDAAMRERAEAFALRVVDVNEFLGSIEPVAKRRPLAMRVAYHDACHLAHAQRIRSQPRALLRSIPELELLEIPDSDQCCGSAGVYNLLEPQSAHEIGTRKVDAIRTLRADVLASANPGCTLQIRSLLAERGETLLAAHPIEILDAAIDGA